MSFPTAIPCPIGLLLKFLELLNFYVLYLIMQNPRMSCLCVSSRYLQWQILENIDFSDYCVFQLSYQNLLLKWWRIHVFFFIGQIWDHVKLQLYSIHRGTVTGTSTFLLLEGEIVKSSFINNFCNICVLFFNKYLH